MCKDWNNKSSLERKESVRLAKSNSSAMLVTEGVNKTIELVRVSVITTNDNAVCYMLTAH